MKIRSYFVIFKVNKSFILHISKWKYDKFVVMYKRICFANLNTRLN